MAASYLNAWKPTCIVAAHNALLPLIVAGSGDPALTIYDSNDVLLAEIPLISAGGEVNQSTGEVTLTAAAREEDAPAGGTASYATLRDGDGAALRSVLCTVTPGTGVCVLSTLTITEGGVVELVSASIL
jgi:hypothetical protein